MVKIKTGWSRRKFITAVAGTGTVLMINPLMSWTNIETDPKVDAIVAKTIGIDTHNHIDVPLVKSEFPGPKVDMSGEMTKSGLSAICMTFALDYQRLTNPGDAFDRFINGLNAMDFMLESNNMQRSVNLADIKASHKEHKATVIQSVEGGHFLEGKLDRLQVAYSRGLRQLGLLHDSDASVPLGDVYTNEPKFGGLTPFGTETIKECNRLGILVDLTHASNQTINAALKVTNRPVIISHTGLDTQLGTNPSMAKMMAPRLISKQQAKIVADAEGVIGVWTHLSDTPLQYAQNIRSLVDVVGTSHVCIGTDTKLTPPYSPNNSGQHGGRMGERTNDAWPDQQVGFYYAVVDALLKTGFTEDEIVKIGGGNFCRIFDAATNAQ